MTNTYKNNEQVRILNVEKMPTDRTRINQALTAYELGFCVIPICGGTKTPAIKYKHFIDGNRPKRKLLSEWFVRNRDWNIGVLLGKSSGGIMAFDFDDQESYRTWEAKKPELADLLPTVRTSRGYHVYFRPIECYSCSHDLRPHITGELKGHGTLTVFPGSEVNGHTYSWVNKPGNTGVPSISLLTSAFIPDTLLSSIQGMQNSDLAENDNTSTPANQGISHRPQSYPVTHSYTQSYPVIPPNPQTISITNFGITDTAQRHHALLKLSAALGNQVGPKGVSQEDALKSHDAWWKQYGKICSTEKEASELEFIDMVDRYRGDGFLWRLAQGFRDAEMPDWAMEIFQTERLTKPRELCRLLAYADHLTNGEHFYLTLRKMMELVGYNTHDAVNNIVYRLCRKKILKIVERGNRKKANVYQILVNSDGETRAANEI